MTSRPSGARLPMDVPMRAGLLALVTLALQVSAGSAAAQASRVASDEAAIRAALEDWVEAANAGDEDRANAIWAPDLIGWYPGQPDDTYEREVTAATERRRSGSRPRFEIGLNVVEVMVSGDHFDVVRARPSFDEMLKRDTIPEWIGRRG